MKRVLITNTFFKGFSGSELATLDIAKTFQSLGWEPVIATFHTDDLLLQHADNLKVINLNDTDSLHGTFDLIWAHHWTVLTYVLYQGTVQAKRVISCSLSPYEPLEQYPTYAGELSLCLANSKETLTVRQSEGVALPESRVFVNAVMPAFLQNTTKPPKKLQRLIVVGNSAFADQEKFEGVLAQKGITVDFFGVGQNRYKMIGPEDLSEYDAVLTIGRTVQYALCLGIPVYCYGRFGGPGYITLENYQACEDMNYSGRERPITRVELQENLLTEYPFEEIADDLVNRYEQVKSEMPQLQEIAHTRYDLKKNILEILDILKSTKTVETSNLVKSGYFVRDRGTTELLVQAGDQSLIRILRKKIKRYRLKSRILLALVITLILYNLLQIVL